MSVPVSGLYLVSTIPEALYTIEYISILRLSKQCTISPCESQKVWWKGHSIGIQNAVAQTKSHINSITMNKPILVWHFMLYLYAKEYLKNTHIIYTSKIGKRANKFVIGCHKIIAAWFDDLCESPVRVVVSFS